VLAPIPDESRATAIALSAAVESTPPMKYISKNQTQMLSRAKPTTTKPITEPARKDTVRASFSPRRAAFAVRALALVAVRIPRKPQRPEKNAPARKANGIHGLCVFHTKAIARKIPKSSSTTTPTMRYCCRR